MPENFKLLNNPNLVLSEDFSSSYSLRGIDGYSVSGAPQISLVGRTKMMSFESGQFISTEISGLSGSAGYSFWVLGTGKNAVPLETIYTGTIETPLIISPSDFPQAALAIQTEPNYILFSGANKNPLDGEKHYLVINSDSEKYTCYLDGEELSGIAISGTNNGKFNFEKITKIVPDFKGNYISDLIVLNRPFDSSEIESLYLNNTWKYEKGIVSFFDLSAPIDSKNNIVGNVFSSDIVSGRKEGLFATSFSGDGKIVFSGSNYYNLSSGVNFSLFAWVNLEQNDSGSIINRFDNDSYFDFNIKSGFLRFETLNGELGFICRSPVGIENNSWKFIGVDYSPVAREDTKFYIDSLKYGCILEKNDYSPTINSGNLVIGNGLIGSIDEIRVYSGINGIQSSNLYFSTK